MRCRQVMKLLGAYRDGELRPTEAGEVSQHISRCGSCRERARQQGQMSQLIREASTEAAPAVFEARFWAAVASRPSSPERVMRWFDLFPARVGLATAGVAALAAVALVPFVLDGQSSTLVAGAPGAVGAGTAVPTLAGAARTGSEDTAEHAAAAEPAVPASWGAGTRIEGYWAREGTDGTVMRYMVGEVSDGSRLRRVSF